MTVIKRPAPPTMASSVPSSTVPTAPSLANRPTAPARPVFIAPPLPKEERTTYERPPVPVPQEQASQKTQTETRRPAPAVVVPAGQPARSGKLGADTRDEEDQEYTGQISRIQLHEMNVVDRYNLWKRLNRGNSTRFITTLRAEEVPKQMVRDIPPPINTKPAGKGVMWCCYCGDWTIFAPFAYTGNDKCIGCSISTKDFYNRTANKLWNEDV